MNKHTFSLPVELISSSDMLSVADNYIGGNESYLLMHDIITSTISDSGYEKSRLAISD